MRAYIGLGSNLGDRAAALDAAIEAIAATPGITVTATSRVRDTEPVGVADQPRFLNAALEVETRLAPEKLLDRLLEIEAQLGRVRAERWGPRVIDLDLLLYGTRAFESERLTVPHPRLTDRRFVLEPLAELCPNLRVPGTGRTVSQLLDASLDGRGTARRTARRARR